MILHIMVYDKFIKDYTDRINKLYEDDEHCFVIFGNKIHDGVKNVKAKNIFIFNEQKRLRKYFFLFQKLFKAKKIIFHSLFFNIKILKFFNVLSCIIGKKYVWFIWGGDLYDYYWHRNENIQYESTRIHFIKNLRYVIVTAKGDYDFLISTYKTRAIMLQAMYSYVLPLYDIKNKSCVVHSNIKILLANSASATCQYEEALTKINQLQVRNIYIYCILSYPKDDDYIEKIINLGRDMFGNLFIPIVDFMNDEEYTRFLSEMDVVIFNHNRQQAFGNILKTLYLGKKVFINPLNTGFDFFSEIGCELYPMSEFRLDNLTELNLEKAQHNQDAILKFYSDENFKNKWDTIFYNTDSQPKWN